jgi:hypothetical protein
MIASHAREGNEMSYRVEAEGQSPLRAASRAAAVAGAVGSVGLTLWVGRGGSSLVLMVLFVGWVLGPLMGLLVADRLSRRWSPATRVTLYIVMLIVAVASVAVYGDVAVRPRATPAFMFLVVPLCSWLLMLTAIPIAAFISRWRQSGGASR